MNRIAMRRPALAVLVVLVLLLGGIVGWWLAMRSMDMDKMTSGLSRNGMDGMQKMGDGTEPGPRSAARMVQVDPVRLQRSGVTYAVARLQPLDLTVRAEASVTYDEERKAEVSTRIAGWVERLYVDKPGQPVRRGQPLLEIYSPELLSTQQELLLALEHAERQETGGRSAPADDRAGIGGRDALDPRSLVDAARRRLELWGVSGGEIERLIRTGDVRRTMPLSSPVSGVVVEKHVLQGARVEPGETLYRIADLSTVWFEARVFEMDLARIAIGQPATITLQAYPGETFTGKVGFIYPFLDPATRTVGVRLEVPNPGGLLKPGMFATATFETSGGRERLVVPASAVVETGERAFVLVKRGEGLFEPREVEIGERAGDQIAIAANLAPGDTIVASANFLIDSEANLMAYMGGMLGMGMRADQMRMDAGEMQGMKGRDGMKEDRTQEPGTARERRR